MIKGFEKITEPLTHDEELLCEVVLSGLVLRSKENPVNGKEICSKINARLSKYGTKCKMTEPRLRKIINHIRVNGIAPVMATSNGYFISYDPATIADQIKSLRDRATGIFAAASGLSKFLTPNQAKLFENDINL